MPTLRMKAKKTGRLRFLSHLETVKMLERSLKRAGVPLTFSQGFNPHANISFAAPLPVGTASQYEVVDVDVEPSADPAALLAVQGEYFPQGFCLLGAMLLDNPKALMKQVGASDYRISYADPVDPEAVREAVSDFLEKTEYMVERFTKKRRRQQVDIRSKVRALEWDSASAILFMRLDTGSHSNLKPLVLLEQILDWQPEKVMVERTALYRISDGEEVLLYDDDVASV